MPLPSPCLSLEPAFLFSTTLLYSPPTSYVLHSNDTELLPIPQTFCVQPSHQVFAYVFFPSSWNAHFTPFYLINSYHCSELLNKVLPALLAKPDPGLSTLILAPSLTA